jgi:hypothetical protein
MSELTFGSLLAAYSLGFVGAIATHWAKPSVPGVWGIILPAAQYASISIAFAYLTTSFYLTYHTGILTMPQVEFERLGIDFALAMAQALFFGFSILRPWSFPLLLGVILFLSGSRQRQEHRALARKLYELICGVSVRGNKAGSKTFRRCLKKFLNDFPELSGWAPTGWLIWLSAAVFFILGLAIGYVVVEFLPKDWPFRNVWQVRTDEFHKQVLIALEVLFSMLVIAIYGQYVVNKRATFQIPDDKGASDLIVEFAQMMGEHNYKPQSRLDPQMDVQFRKLEGQLEGLCTKISQK